jgi:hypothetical protein
MGLAISNRDLADFVSNWLESPHPQVVQMPPQMRFS